MFRKVFLACLMRRSQFQLPLKRFAYDRAFLTSMSCLAKTARYESASPLETLEGSERKLCPPSSFGTLRAWMTILFDRGSCDYAYICIYTYAYMNILYFPPNFHHIYTKVLVRSSRRL